MAISRNDMVEMATARANVYGLLANIFREEPSETLLSKLGEPDFTSALKHLNVSLDEMFYRTSHTQLVEDLALEFTRLFIGPGPHISPNESMHVEARFGEPNAYWGAQTVEVKKFMEAAGMHVADDFGGMPDHISAEFEFMQRLLLKEVEAWENLDNELGVNILNIENQFFEVHLSQWVSNFCDKVIEAAEHPFYKQFSDVTKGFIEFEKEALEELVDDATEGDRLSA